jgi:hypothetical protein
MFGTPESTCKSFSETWELLPFSDDDESEEGAIEQGKVLSSEELIERLQNINNIFSSGHGGRGYSPEAFALLCTLLTCASWSKENRALFNPLPALLDSDSNVVDIRSDSDAVHSCENERSYDDVFIFENVRDYRLYYFETVYCVNEVDFCKVLPVNTLSRGPPQRGCNYFADSKDTNKLIDIVGVYSAPAPDKNADSQNNCLQYVLPINSLQYQVNGGSFHETA